MAQLQITFPAASVQEGEGSFEVKFTLIEEEGDPTTPNQSFLWYLTPGAENSAEQSDFDSTLGAGFINNFTGYGPENSQTIALATPAIDGLEESDETINLVVNQLSNGLTLAPGSNKSTALEIIDECFLRGTNILTEDGYRQVEDLEIGDKVKTFDGQLVSIKWIGRQTRHRFTAHRFRSLPIQIKAGALGGDLPRRDLFVSPDHAILIDGLLINAGALENGVSIVKTYPEQYVYYHIELEHHALLDAEGAPAESFFPNQEDRSTYDNVAEYEQLYPHGSNLMLWPMDYPRISSRNKVPRFVSSKLMEIANELYGKEVSHTA
ncbi:MAG: Hint domain-containing protein [Xenococcus sp. MO_188.B8]|nr:Hint domain-containing protein [Xenococcus sp. MO_188.B8]